MQKVSELPLKSTIEETTQALDLRGAELPQFIGIDENSTLRGNNLSLFALKSFLAIARSRLEGTNPRVSLIKTEAADVVFVSFRGRGFSTTEQELLFTEALPTRRDLFDILDYKSLEAYETDAKREKIFDRQIPENMRLTIAKSLIEDQSGQIGLVSEPMGAVLYFAVPKEGAEISRATMNEAKKWALNERNQVIEGKQ